MYSFNVVFLTSSHINTIWQGLIFLKILQLYLVKTTPIIDIINIYLFVV